ncbi:MAG: hypothetical protein ACFB21_07885 [Opitutales bacterium]
MHSNCGLSPCILPFNRRLLGSCLLAGTFLCYASPALAAETSRLSDEPIPLQTEGFPERPQPIVELGENPFLGTGFIGPGFTTPTGAQWQPLFIVYGEFRSALQYFESGQDDGHFAEWANRLDLFGNLYLTPTERFNIGFRPLDENGEFSGYRFDDNSNDDDFVNQINGMINTLFFEGDFGEIFPNLDPDDTRNLDYGFAVGRQPLLLQDGVLINDEVDSIGVTRTSLFLFGSSAFRITGLFGWGEVDRGNNIEDSSAWLGGISTSGDWDKHTLDVDALYSWSDADTGDQLNVGASLIRRFGHLNATLSVNGSVVTVEPDVAPPAGRNTAVDDGVLFLGQFSMTPPYTHDLVYLNTFLGVENFRSIARSPATGGPLGRVGILFASVGLGRYGAPLSNDADSSTGAAVGYQKFFNGGRQQLVAEVGGRVRYDDQPGDGAAAGLRYQHALGQHVFLTGSSFVGYFEERDVRYGLRSEITVRF